MALIDNLVSYWKTDEASGDRLDAHGPNDLTDVNTVGSATGIINSGADFEKDNSERLSIADASQTGLEPSAFSVSLWVKFESQGNFRQGLLVKSYNIAGDSPYYSYGIFLAGDDEGSKLFFILADGGSVGAQLSSTTDPTTGTWYHVVATYNGTTKRLYINGSEEANASASAPNFSTGVFSLGAEAVYGFYADAIIDEVGFWSRAITADEVAELYNSGSALAYPFSTGPSLPTLDTLSATGINHSSATLNGEITDTGGENADERGFVWGTTTQGDPGDVAPASAGYDDNSTETGDFPAETFAHAIVGLTPETTYYVRAYAHNSAGYAYGDEISFATDVAPTFRFTNIAGVVFNEADTTTIFAERLNDILDRLDALE